MSREEAQAARDARARAMAAAASHAETMGIPEEEVDDLASAFAEAMMEAVGEIFDEPETQHPEHAAIWEQLIVRGAHPDDDEADAALMSMAYQASGFVGAEETKEPSEAFTPARSSAGPEVDAGGVAAAPRRSPRERCHYVARACLAVSPSRYSRLCGSRCSC